MHGLTCQQHFYLNEINALQECGIHGYTNDSTLNTPKAKPISRVLKHPGHIFIGNSSSLILLALHPATFSIYKMHPLNPLIPNAAVYPQKQWANKSVFSHLFSSGSVTPKYLLAAPPPLFTCSTMRANNGPKWQPRLILYVAIMRGQAFLAVYSVCH